MTIGNGPAGGDGQTRLHYTIENIKRDEICQNEDTVALPPGATLKSVFFSDSGVSVVQDSLNCRHFCDASKLTGLNRIHAFMTLPAHY